MIVSAMEVLEYYVPESVFILCFIFAVSYIATFFSNTKINLKNGQETGIKVAS